MKGIILVVAVMVASTLAGQLSCPKEQADNWEVEQLLEHADCDKFYKCTYGEPVEQMCPVGLHFNINIGACDWTDNVDCGSRNDPLAPVPEEVASAEVEDAEETVKSEDFSEENDAENKASSEEIVEKEESGNTSETEEAPKEEEEAENKSVEEGETEVTEFLPNGCPVNPHVFWLLPNEENEHEFYYCVWGEKKLSYCSGNLIFNPAIQVCDWQKEADDQE